MQPEGRRVVSYRNSTSNHNYFSDYTSTRSCCILSKFYIKPQQYQPNSIRDEVVSYRNSTSNHNYADNAYLRGRVVSYRNSTSNHNSFLLLLPPWLVVSYRNSTSNHNSDAVSMTGVKLYLIEILHQTTTCGKCEECLRRCILSKFYIKPQRRERYNVRRLRCILSKFYIKPQLRLERELARCSCILSKFYIKPQL